MGSSYVTTHTSPQELRRRNERLPLAITIHYNWFLSLTFAIIAGCLAFEKNSLFYCNSFQRLLLRPTFSIWLITELPRLYLGQKGVLSDKLPELAAFLLLSFFPQVWIVLYLGFLQEMILPIDTILGGLMIFWVVTEIILAWRCLRDLAKEKKQKTFYKDMTEENALTTKGMETDVNDQTV